MLRKYFEGVIIGFDCAKTGTPKYVLIELDNGLKVAVKFCKQFESVARHDHLKFHGVLSEDKYLAYPVIKKPSNLAVLPD